MWTCPKCGSKVDPGFEVCWNCGTSREGVEDPNFVTADEAPAIEEPPVTSVGSEISADLTPIDEASELVVCYSAADHLEAKFLADCLIEQGIPAIPDTYDLHDALGTMNATPNVHVPADRLAEARAWLEEYERNRAGSGDAKSVLGD